MTPIKVVTEAHWDGDKTVDLEILDKSDIRDEIKTALVKYSTSEDMERMIDQSVSELRSYVDSNAQEAHAEFAKLMEDGLEKLQKAFSDDFVETCRGDMRDYLRELGDWAKKVDQKTKQLENMHKEWTKTAEHTINQIESMRKDWSAKYEQNTKQIESMQKTWNDNAKLTMKQFDDKQKYWAKTSRAKSETTRQHADSLER